MLRLEIVGIGEKRAQLMALGAALTDDWDDLWDEYARIMVQTEETWFQSEGDGLWPPLADSTQAYKESHGYPPETMIRRGLLAESLVDPAQAMEIGQGRSTLGTFTRSSMTWGTSVTDDRGREFAHYHQHTDPVTGEWADYGDHPPLRQVIPDPLPAYTQAEMLAADEAWLEEAIGKAGLAA